ncbi:hypothetical protein FB480_103565 [Agrobacterium vitis]|nr:hypothetical protein FB480_103565 [Agrobacterium vitis]
MLCKILKRRLQPMRQCPSRCSNAIGERIFGMMRYGIFQFMGRMAL